MSKTRVFGLLLDDSRMEILDGGLHSELPFTEPVPDFEFSGSRRLVTIVINSSGNIQIVAFGNRGGPAGTQLRKLSLTDAKSLQHSIPIDYIESHVSSRVRQRVSRSLKEGGLCSAKASSEIIETLIQMSDVAKSLFGRLSEAHREKMRRLNDREKTALGEQQSAVLNLLQISGQDRTSLQSWTHPDMERPSSYLDGLPELRLREDSMVVSDLNRVPGHKLVHQTSYSSAIFESETTRLTLVLANKLPLEQQTGVDLIYYNEKYGSFIMVQYKAMEKESYEAVFRLPNDQLSTEIQRMDKLAKLLSLFSDDAPSRDGYRLCSNPFYLKLCPRLVFDPDSSAMTPGMYLSLPYWKTIVVHKDSYGRRGGNRVTFASARRYFNNTEFVTLVSNSWIGSTQSQSRVLAAIIRKVLKSGRTLALGIPTDLKDEEEPYYKSQQ